MQHGAATHHGWYGVHLVIKTETWSLEGETSRIYQQPIPKPPALSDVSGQQKPSELPFCLCFSDFEVHFGQMELRNNTGNRILEAAVLRRDKLTREQFITGYKSTQGKTSLGMCAPEKEFRPLNGLSTQDEAALKASSHSFSRTAFSDIHPKRGQQMDLSSGSTD